MNAFSEINTSKLEDNILENEFINKTEFTFQRWQLNRILKALNNHGDKINGLFLVRAMYGCNLETAKFIYNMIIKMRD